MQLLVVDMETTGVDPEIHAPISIGWVLLSDSLEEVRVGSALIQPFSGAVVDPKAMEINKLDISVCNMMGHPEAEILDMIEHQVKEYERMSDVPADMITKTIWAGHSTHFDWGFYQAMLRRNKRMQPKEFHYHLLDTFSIGMSRLYGGSIGNALKACKLQNLTAESGSLLKTPHQALADAMATAEIIKRSMTGNWGKLITTGIINGEDTESLKAEEGRPVPRHQRS